MLNRDLDWSKKVEASYTEVGFIARYGNQDIDRVERWSKTKRRLVFDSLAKLIKHEFKDR